MEATGPDWTRPQTGPVSPTATPVTRWYIPHRFPMAKRGPGTGNQARPVVSVRDEPNQAPRDPPCRCGGCHCRGSDRGLLNLTATRNGPGTGNQARPVVSVRDEPNQAPRDPPCRCGGCHCRGSDRGLLNLTATRNGPGTGNQARPVAQAEARPAMFQGNPHQEARDERLSRSSGIPT